MAFTTHGHHIPGTTMGTPPNQRARCGGVERCPKCKSEVSEFHFEGLRTNKPADKGEEFVRKYVNNQNFGNARFDVQLITFTYILGGWKAFYTTDIENGTIYEVICKKDDNRLIMNVYQKQDNFHISL